MGVIFNDNGPEVSIPGHSRVSFKEGKLVRFRGQREKQLDVPKS